MRAVTIQLLGHFSVAVDGAAVSSDTWRSRRAADIVKLLALAPGHRMHRIEVMEALWPDSDPEASGTNLRKALHFCRRATGDERSIVNEGGLLALWPDALVETDVEHFETAAQRALDGQDAASARSAADLYRGDLLSDDRYESWSAEPRARLRQHYLDALRAGALWDRLAEEDPTDEQAARSLMRAHLDAGERREAIRRFERLREALRDELGVGPDPATVTLYEEVLALEGAPQPTAAERTHALLAWALLHMNRGDVKEAERAAEEAQAIALDAGLNREIGEAAEILAKTAMAQGRWRERFATEFARSMQADIAPIIFDANLCLAEYYLAGPDGHDAAAGLARQILEMAHKAGSPTGAALALLMLGEAELLAGDVDTAEEHLKGAADANDREGVISGSVLSRQRLAEAAVAHGRRYEANRLLGRAHSLAIRSDFVAHLLVRVFGTMIDAAPDPQKAMTVLQVAEQELKRTASCEPCSMGYMTSAARASAKAGQLDRARSFLAQAERISGMWQSGFWDGAVWEARGVIRQAEGEADQARAMYREAAAAFTHSGNESDAARLQALAVHAGDAGSKHSSAA